MPLAQTFPITPQTVDKFLSLDPLSLAMVIGVVVVLTLLINSYFQGRGTTAAGVQQTAVIKFFTDENSPMVVSNKRVAEAIEVSNQRAAEQTVVLRGLGESTTANTLELTKQTAELGKQTNVIEGLSNATNQFSTLVTRDLSTQTESIAALTKTINDLNSKIDQLIQDLIQDKSECIGLREQLTAFRVEFIGKLESQKIRATSTNNTVVVPEQVLTVEVQKELEPML